MKERVLSQDTASIFLFLYGIIIQGVSFPILIYFTAVDTMAGLIGTLMMVWYFIPVIALFGVLLALVQIRRKKQQLQSAKFPVTGLCLNIGWLVCYALYFLTTLPHA